MSPLELQAVVLACGDNARFYPFTEDPVALLPVLNRPLLRYQLDLLAKAKFSEALVVVSKGGTMQMARFLEEYDGPIKVRTATASSGADMGGVVDTAEALRSVRDKIQGDFVVLPGDIVCDEVLRDMAMLHRQHGSDLTMLLVEEAPAADAKGKKVLARPKHDGSGAEDPDCIGLAQDGRVLIKVPSLDLEGAVTVQKALLKRGGSISLSLRLQDVNVYICSYGVLAFLDEHPQITSLQRDLVPALVRRQFRNAAGSSERLLPSRRASASSDGRSAPGATLTGADAELLAVRSSGTAAEGELCLAGDALRCYALVCRHSGPTARFCVQARNLATYVALNRDLMAASPSESCPWSLPPQLNRKDQVLMGAGCQVAAEKVACKLSVLGAGCSVGARCKINSCVLMDGVTVGAGSTIQNCVVGANATIGENCNLNDCQVAAHTIVEAGTKEKQQTFGRFD